jgi:hypothetical protein
MLRAALWCVLSFAAAGCTLIGEGELNEKPAEDGAGGVSGATATTSGAGGATASSAEATTATGPGPGPTGPGAGGGEPGCEPACLAGSFCQGSSCVCGSPKAPAAGGCPPECNAGCDTNKGICRIERDEECSGTCPQTIVCPPGMECEIRCKGDKPCYEATIQCPETFACRVECDGYQACKSSHLIGTTGALTLTCKDIQPCQDMDLDCGAGKCDYPCINFEGTVACGASCDCDGC